MEQLIILLGLALLSGISTWLQKRRQQQQEQSSDRPADAKRPATGESHPAPPPRAFDWEKELRRLLESETESTPPPAPAPKPEVAREIAPAPAARPIPPPVPLARVQEEVEILYTESEELAARQLGRMTESAAAHARVSQLSEATAARLRKADEKIERHDLSEVTGHARRPSPALSLALAQLRSPAHIQQAFITATILGPAKALAPQDPAF